MNHLQVIQLWELREIVRSVSTSIRSNPSNWRVQWSLGKNDNKSTHRSLVRSNPSLYHFFRWDPKRKTNQPFPEIPDSCACGLLPEAFTLNWNCARIRTVTWHVWACWLGVCSVLVGKVMGTNGVLWQRSNATIKRMGWIRWSVNFST